MNWGFWAPFLLISPAFCDHLVARTLTGYCLPALHRATFMSNASTGNTKAKSHQACFPPRMLKNANTSPASKDSGLQLSERRLLILFDFESPSKNSSDPAGAESSLPRPRLWSQLGSRLQATTSSAPPLRHSKSLRWNSSSATLWLLLCAFT